MEAVLGQSLLSLFAPVQIGLTVRVSFNRRQQRKRRKLGIQYPCISGNQCRSVAEDCCVWSSSHRCTQMFLTAKTVEAQCVGRMPSLPKLQAFVARGKNVLSKSNSLQQSSGISNEREELQQRKAVSIVFFVWFDDG